MSNEKINQNTNRENLKLAFDLAEFYFKVPKLLDPEDIDSDIVDERSIMTYLSSLFISLSQAKYSDTNSNSKNCFHENHSQLNSLCKWIDEKIFFLQNNEDFSDEFLDKTQISGIKNFYSTDLYLNDNEIKKIITEYEKKSSEIGEQHIYHELLNKWDILKKLVENKNTELDKVDFEYEKTKKDFKYIESQINILEGKLQETYSKISTVNIF